MKTEYTILYESPEVRFYEFKSNVVLNASYKTPSLDPEDDEFLDY